MDSTTEAGYSPDFVAEKILKSVIEKKKEVLFSFDLNKGKKLCIYIISLIFYEPFQYKGLHTQFVPLEDESKTAGYFINVFEWSIPGKPCQYRRRSLSDQFRTPILAVLSAISLPSWPE
ncbi:hypothetical protein NQ317_016138 [Molorchus minor]|uniref:Uncharacterized protein n=1 Tax=Molorchus minor TaxID=1323400 RepID=A0ABQ9IYP0_9CUCU|nr:hypothetical protein NQ317_016138 [Molorchus minor]